MVPCLALQQAGIVGLALAPVGAMPARRGRSKSKSPWVPRGGAPDPRWPKAVADRLGEVRRGFAEGSGTAASSSGGPTTPGIEPSAMPGMPPFAASEGVQPRGQPEDPHEELAALRFARAQPSAFSVQRHAVMILGRPVVVPQQQEVSFWFFAKCFDVAVVVLVLFAVHER